MEYVLMIRPCNELHGTRNRTLSTFDRRQEKLNKARLGSCPYELGSGVQVIFGIPCRGGFTRRG
jgi:hypothetical protein